MRWPLHPLKYLLSCVHSYVFVYMYIEKAVERPSIIATPDENPSAMAFIHKDFLYYDHHTYRILSECSFHMDNYTIVPLVLEKSLYNTF